MTGAEYKPVFNPSVGVIGPGIGVVTQFTPINPIYCLTVQSAQDLASVLADLKPQIFLAMPFGPWPAGPFSQTTNVPWFRFSNGGATYESNAGLLAAYWTHGGDGEAMARGDIALGLQNAAAGM